MQRNAAHSRLARHPRSRASSSRDPRTGRYANISAIEALSAASDQYTRNTNGHRGPTRKPSLTLSVIAALVVWAVLVVAGRFEYRCCATLQCAGLTDPETMQSCRRELLDYAWRSLAVDGSKPVRWSVDVPGGDLLRLTLTTSNRAVGVEQARTIAQGYLAAMQAKAAKVRVTPTGAEDVLSGFADELLARLQDAQMQVEDAVAALPEADSREDRQALLDRWQAQRTRFSSIRSQLSQVSTRLAELQSEPDPAFAVVSSKERHGALEADVALQQDLAELEVQLTELKLHLLNVWHKSASAFEQLTMATDDLLETVARHQTTPRQSTRGKDGPLLADAGPYADLLDAFAESWKKEFAALKEMEVDALSNEVLDVHPRVRRRLHDFLFNAGKRLAAMRAQVSALGDGAADQASYHVLESDLMRGFRTVQAAHHRFEFAAGAIEARDNFRLDIALQGARGLRRRSVRVIQAIDEHLQAKAVQRARQQRTQAVAEAKRNLDSLSESAYDTVAELIELQDELNISAGLTEEFLHAFLYAEAAGDRLETTQRDLTSTQSRLRELAARRASAADPPNMKIISCGVIGPPTNLTERLRFGGGGALLVLLTVFLGQWWITRRS